MKICIMGLGYVGLPLAIQLARHFSLVGFDIDRSRITELKTHHDRTQEVDAQDLKSTTIQFSYHVRDIKHCDVYIVTVPTPVTTKNKPDLNPLKKACEVLARVLSKGATVVFESTVYPGITEDFCGELIEKKTGLVSGKDFFLGYSPERMNPGDKEHTVSKITKIIAAQTPDVEKTLQNIYGCITNVFIAKNIKTAEAAKVIENTQRDINIAFINELMQIFSLDNLSIYDILEAAQTKWNFLPFSPGLVGGHCIGVDPYYLASYSKKLGYKPEVTLAGRTTNNKVPFFLAHKCHQALRGEKSSILILGLSFKENIPDLRNTKVVPLIHHLQRLGHTVHVVDPLVNAAEAERLYAIKLFSLNELTSDTYACIIGAVNHQAFLTIPPSVFQRIGKNPCYLLDIKKMWRFSFPDSFRVIPL